MTIAQLKQFIGVVEYMSFTKASEVLYSHQSTISKGISRLEREFGVTFFVRENNVLKLTFAGKCFYENSLRLIQEFEELGRITRQIASGQMGTITFHCIEVYLLLMLKSLNSFKKVNPAVEFVFENCSYDNIPSILDHVASGEADIGMIFSIYMPEDRGGYEVIPFVRERFCLIMAKNHPLASRERIRLGDLERVKVLMGNHIPTSIIGKINDAMRDTLHAPPLEVERCFRPDSPDALLLQLMNDEYVTIAPRYIAEQSGPDLACLEMDGVDMSFDVCLVYKRGSPNSSLKLLTEDLERRRKDSQGF